MTKSARSEPSYRPEVPVLKRNGFQLYKDNFSVDNIHRVSGPRLLDLFHPDTVKRRTDQTVARIEARRLFNKAFFTAQLRYYGIPFSPSAKSSTLKALLRDEVCEGKVGGQ